MKRTFTKYPSNIYGAKHIKYDTTDMTLDGETPQEIVDLLYSVVSKNNLNWFYGCLDKIKIHWGHPCPTIVCNSNNKAGSVLTSNYRNGTIDWDYTPHTGWPAKTLREMADQLDVLNNSTELNDLILNFAELYGEDV